MENLKRWGGLQLKFPPCGDLDIFLKHTFLITFVGSPPLAAPRISLKNSSSFLLDQILIVVVPFD